MTIVLTAEVAFIVTNIDDIFLLAVYFTQVGPSLRIRHIVLGQYIGFTLIMAISLLGFLGALVIPEEAIGLLGIAPVYMGIRRLLQGHQETSAEQEIQAVKIQDGNSFLASFLNPQTYSVAVVTFANGGDNISIYIPLFAGRTIIEIGVVLIVFVLLLAVWCYLGYRIGSYPVLTRIIQQYGHYIVPVVLIGLGLFILIENGTLHATLELFQ